MKIEKKQVLPMITVFIITAAAGMLHPPTALPGLNPPPEAFDAGGNPVATMKTIRQAGPQTPIDALPFEISSPGAFYLTANLTVPPDTNGITIAASNVSLDLKGFTLTGNSGGARGKGIVVNGSRKNIFIHNGNVNGWKEDGIDATASSGAVFRNLRLRENGNGGLAAGIQSIITQCVAMLNGGDGLKGGNGTRIKNSASSENGGNGITISEGGSILDSTAYKNVADGFELSNGSTVNRCVAIKNGAPTNSPGFDLATGCSAMTCSASQNGNGFDYETACAIRVSLAAYNDGDGFRGDGAGALTGNKSHENGLAEIHITGSGSRIEANHCTSGTVKIKVEGSGNLVVRNAVEANGQNYEIALGNPYGPIVNVNSGDEISNTSPSNHPMANFKF